MSGTFITGETKIRPGTYFNIQKAADSARNAAEKGVTAVLFKADFGPLMEAVELNAEKGYEKIFGTGLTTDAIREAFAGGVQTVIACRIGKGGKAASVKLNAAGGSEDAITITAKYPGAKDFTITVREKLTDTQVKECIIFSGTKEFEKTEFPKGGNEAEALAAAFSDSIYFTARTEGNGGELGVVSQEAFTAGENPTVSAQEYSEGFSAVEAFDFHTICVDTEDTAIHVLMAAFLDRILDGGQLAQGVVAEKESVELETRMAHGAAFNNEKMNYVLNAKVREGETELDGYQTAARAAGMIAACPSNASLTHAVLEGITEIGEKLTPSQVEKAENSGCLVLTYSASKQVWIDYGINTLTAPADGQDEGWKKIRRVKTRFELIRRVNQQTEGLIGKVDNDKNGRATVVSQVQGIGTAMVEEGKLVACKVTESEGGEADGDSAWFHIDVIDKDSIEHMYLTFKFRFSTREEE